MMSKAGRVYLCSVSIRDARLARVLRGISQTTPNLLRACSSIVTQIESMYDLGDM